MAENHKEEWAKAMQEEMKSLYENDPDNLVSIAQGNKGLEEQMSV